MARVAHVLQTRRLHLRSWRASDAPAVRAALDASDAHLRPWVPFMEAEPRTLAGTTEWLASRRARFVEGEHFCYGVFTRDGAALLGEAHLLDREGPGLEIGYWIDVRQIGHGYATEAAAALVHSAFAHHASGQLAMVCDARNTSSWAIPSKLGFTSTETRTAHEGSGELHIWTLAAGAAVHVAIEVEALDADGRALEA